MSVKRNKNQELIFDDFPEFKPNLTPREIFLLGSFGGTYWRPIYSSVTNKHYHNKHKQYPASWWENIPELHLTRDWDNYDKSINKYGSPVYVRHEIVHNKQVVEDLKKKRSDICK